jgi:VWFA-related protein
VAARQGAPVTRIMGAALLTLASVSTLVVGQEPIFRSRVEAVRVDVSVTRGGAPVPGLTAVNFDVLDNGVPQTVERVSVEEVALSLLMVLDTSGSLAHDPLQQLVAAGVGLVRSLRPDDRVALVTFAQQVEVQVPLTAARQDAIAALQRLEAAGPTALNDALFMALQMKPEESADTRPVVLIFSDGRDTVSWLADAEVEAAVRRSGVVVHAIELVTSPPIDAERGAGAPRPSPALARLVGAGGGRQWAASSASDLKGLFATALNELRARYLLTYYPQGVARAGWHDVQVRLKSARGEVVARPGYFVPPTP